MLKPIPLLNEDVHPEESRLEDRQNRSWLKAVSAPLAQIPWSSRYNMINLGKPIGIKWGHMLGMLIEGVKKEL